MTLILETFKIHRSYKIWGFTLFLERSAHPQQPVCGFYQGRTECKLNEGRGKKCIFTWESVCACVSQLSPIECCDAPVILRPRTWTEGKRERVTEEYASTLALIPLDVSHLIHTDTHKYTPIHTHKYIQVGLMCLSRTQHPHPLVSATGGCDWMQFYEFDIVTPWDGENILSVEKGVGHVVYLNITSDPVPLRQFICALKLISNGRNDNFFQAELSRHEPFSWFWNTTFTISFAAVLIHTTFLVHFRLISHGIFTRPCVLLLVLLPYNNRMTSVIFR